MKPSLLSLLWRGFRGRCPCCGQGRVLDFYARPAGPCRCCRTDFRAIRADDGPAYFTLFCVAHLVVPPVLWVEQVWSPPMAVFLAVALCAAAALTVLLLPRFKGATIALMWHLSLRGDERHDQTH